MNKQELIKSLKLTRDSYSNEDSFRGGVRTGLGIALGVIEELDEPEMLSDDFLRSRSDWVNLCHTGEQVRAVKCDVLRNVLAPKVNEPSKPVIPKFVAEAFEKVKGSNVYAESILKDMYNSSDEVAIWLVAPSNEKLLLRAWLDGYEVEEEKLYYVLNKHGQTLLVFIGGVVCLSSGYVLRDGNKDKYQLTEKQIKDYDERYWEFAVEVTE